MKYVRYVNASGCWLAVEDGEGGYAPVPKYRDLIVALNDGVDLPTLGADALKKAARIKIKREQIIAPISPPSMRDCMCFHEHIRNCLGDFDERHEKFPAFYLSNHAGVIGPYDDVAISPGCEQFDYELEICAVIGQRCYNVPPSKAQSLIAGYTMYVDWSARDLQMYEMAVGLGPAKGKDSAITLGPKFVTADEFESRSAGKGFDIEMTARVNGKAISKGNWKTINWSFADVLAYTSRGTTLVPGDVLGSGTVGRGCLFELYKSAPDEFPGWLKPGDVVELSVDLIGATRQVVRESDVLHPLSSGF